MRVFAVGPLSNFVVAIVCLLLFSFVFIGSVQPIDGAEVLFSYQDTPADEINIPTGSVIISFNDTPIHNSQDFSEAIDKTSPNQTVNISYITDVDLEPIHAQVTLTSLYDVVSIRDDETINESTLKNTSFLGIRFNTYSKEFISSLKNPLTYKFPTGLANTFAIPIYGYIASYNPISEPYINTYKINGPLGFLPRGIFWGIVTALYWIFWLNLAVGLFNVLPITPLDGGFIFNDGIRAIVQRFKKDISEEKRDRIVRYISLIVSLSVLGLALFPFFFKYI